MNRELWDILTSNQCCIQKNKTQIGKNKKKICANSKKICEVKNSITKNLIGPYDPTVDEIPFRPNPVNGDEFVNSETGKRYIYQDNMWQEAPCCIQFNDVIDSDLVNVIQDGVTGPTLVTPPETEGKYIWCQGTGPFGEWVPEQFYDAKNIIGSSGATGPGSDVPLPAEGDEWVNSTTGKRFIYQNSLWQEVPCCLQFSDVIDSDLVNVIQDGVTGPTLVTPPETEGKYIWCQGTGAGGEWVPEQSYDAKNIIGSSGATGPGSDVPLPAEGDEWVNSTTGKRFIYQNSLWQETPCCTQFVNVSGSDFVNVLQDGNTGPSLIVPPEDEGKYLWCQGTGAAGGEWVNEQLFDAKSIIGSSGATGPESDVTTPTEGDLWINSMDGTQFVYQNGSWIQVPSLQNRLSRYFPVFGGGLTRTSEVSSIISTVPDCRYIQENDIFVIEGSNRRYKVVPIGAVCDTTEYPLPFCTDLKLCELPEDSNESSGLLMLKNNSSPIYNPATCKFEIIYHITIANIGNLPISNIVINDTHSPNAVNENVTFLSSPLDSFFNNSFDGIDQTGGEPRLINNGSLAVGESKHVEYLLTFDEFCDTERQLTNTLSLVSAVDNNGSAVVSEPVLKRIRFNDSFQGAVSITKLFDQVIVERNGNLTLHTRIEVTNIGSVKIVLNSIEDDLFSTLSSNNFTINNHQLTNLGSVANSLVLNSGYDGSSNINHIDVGSGTLAGRTILPRQKFMITYDLVLDDSLVRNTNLNTYTNNVIAKYTGPLCEPEHTTSSVAVYRCQSNPSLNIKQQVVSIITNRSRTNVRGDPNPLLNPVRGEISYKVTLEFEAKNIGESIIHNLQITNPIRDGLRRTRLAGGDGGEIFNLVIKQVSSFPSDFSTPALWNNFNGGTIDTEDSFNPETRMFRNGNSRRPELRPGDGFIVIMEFDYVPPNNSDNGATNVTNTLPICGANVSGEYPAVDNIIVGTAEYTDLCGNAITQDFQTVVKSMDHPAVHIDSSIEHVMDLSIGAGTPDSGITGGTGPPDSYNTYQITLKYKITNSGDTPIDNITLCDDFFDQNQGPENVVTVGTPLDVVPFRDFLVIIPPRSIEQTDNADEGTVAGNGNWQANSTDSVVASGSGMLLPGSTLEFWTVVRIRVDPTVTIRIQSNAHVYARGPNEHLLENESTSFLPVVGPSMMVTKSFAAGYPYEVAIGQFRAALIYEIYNDGDRRVNDLVVTDHFTNSVYTIQPGSIDVAPISTATIRRAETGLIESPGSFYSTTWDGTAVNDIVNSPPLVRLERGDRYIVTTPEFTFLTNNQGSATNVASACGTTVYDNPELNIAPTNGVLCDNGGLNVTPRNEITCPSGLINVLSVNLISTADPNNVTYEATYSINVTNVGVPTVESLSVSFASGFSDPEYSNNGPIIITSNPAPLSPGTNGNIEFTLPFIWSPSTPYDVNNPPNPLTQVDDVIVNITAGNTQSFPGDTCQILTAPFAPEDPHLSLVLPTNNLNPLSSVPVSLGGNNYQYTSSFSVLVMNNGPDIVNSLTQSFSGITLSSPYSLVNVNVTNSLATPLNNGDSQALTFDMVYNYDTMGSTGASPPIGGGKFITIDATTTPFTPLSINKNIANFTPTQIVFP